MGRLIDVDEVKKRLPIMENDWGMVINKTLHKELDKVPTVEAISKADMMDILNKIKAEIEEEYDNCYICEWYEDYDYEENDISEYQSVGTVSDILTIIDKYKAESKDRMSKETTCENCINANKCIMYEPKMKRCKDYKESEDKK